MKLQRLLSLLRQAIDQYQMIEHGDHIAIGISGGKDSLTLLYGLSQLQKFYPKHFTLSAITVDMGLDTMNLEPVKTLCADFNVPYEIISTEIGKILFEARNEANPCSLCAKMRKGALNQKALELGCNKIAYAHHKDDLIETALMSLLYMDGHTHREYVKNLIRTLNTDSPGVRERLFHAVINGNFEDWPKLSK